MFTIKKSQSRERGIKEGDVGDGGFPALAAHFSNRKSLEKIKKIIVEIKSVFRRSVKTLLFITDFNPF